MMRVMSTVNLASIDLNLLVVLDAVLETSSATQASKRLFVTQSAVSNALRRLRELFGDPLLVRTARGLTPTPRAAELAPELRRWLDDARTMLGAPRFDPATTARRFTIAGTDAAFRQRFPMAFLRFVTLERLVAQDGLGSGDVDLHIGVPPSLSSSCRSELLYEDRFVTIAPRRMKIRRMDLRRFAALPHYEMALFGEPDDDIDRLLREQGLTRVVCAGVPHLSLLPQLVAAGDGIATVSEGLVLASGVAHLLDRFPPPIPLPPLRIVQVWHQRSETDAGVAALRALVKEVARGRENRTGTKRRVKRA